MKYPKTFFAVTSWDDSLFLQLKQKLLTFGVEDEQIHRLQERQSRSITLNRAITKAYGLDTDYMVFLDEDIDLPDSHVFDRLKEGLLSTGAIGVIANPKLIQEGQNWSSFARDLPVNAPIDVSLADCGSNLVSLNCAMFDYHKLGNACFDEDLFGNQNLDTDFGWQLVKQGYKIFVDMAVVVTTRANNYFTKSLSYHAIVARNLHVLKAKWSSIDSWLSVKDYNQGHNNEIPSLEELTHWSEIKQMQYCYQYNRDGLSRCYLSPRFGNVIAVGGYVQTIEQSLANLPNLAEFTIGENRLPVFK